MKKNKLWVSEKGYRILTKVHDLLTAPKSRIAIIARRIVHFTALIGAVLALSIFLFEGKFDPDFIILVVLLGFYLLSALISLLGRQWGALYFGLAPYHYAALLQLDMMQWFMKQDWIWLLPAFLALIWVVPGSGIIAKSITLLTGNKHSRRPGKTLFPRLAKFLTHYSVLVLGVIWLIGLLDATDVDSVFSDLGQGDWRKVVFSFGVVAAVLAYFLSMVLNLINRRWKDFFIGLAPYHFGLLVLIFDQSDILKSAWPVTVPLALAWFAADGKIFSKVFAVVFVLTYIAAGGLAALLLLLICLFLRYLVLAFVQNWEVFSKIESSRSKRIFFKSALYWLPILTLAYPGYLWMDYSYAYSYASLYCAAQNEPVDGVETCIERQVGRDLSSADRQKEIRKKTESFYVNQENKIDNWEERAKKLNNDSREDVLELTLDGYDRTIPQEIAALQPQDCGFLDMSCYSGNSLRSCIRESYDEARIKERIRLEEGIEDGWTGDDGIESAAGLMEQKIKGLKQASLNTLDSTFWVLDKLGMIFVLSLFLLCLRSFLYVLARVAFENDSGALVSLREDDGAMPRGSVRLVGNEYQVDLVRDGEFYAARNYQPQGQAPKFSVPQPGAVPLARLLNGAWGMNHLKKIRGRPKVRFSAAQGQEFVVRTIKKGEVVIFDFKDFVAMSSTIKLSSIVSLRVSSLLLGKIVFPAAEGPGKLVLKSHGKPASVKQSSNITVTVSPGRLLAWQKNAQFSVDSTLSFADIYFSGFYLQPIEQNLVVIDVDRQHNRETGLGQFIRHFLTPW